MPRDDSYLYTGMTSASQRKADQKRALLKEQKKDERGKLTPAAELVNEIIDKHLKEVTDISNFVVTAESPVEDLKSVLLARKMHHQFLISLKTQISNKLREQNDGRA